MTSEPGPADFDDQLLHALRTWTSDRALEGAQRGRSQARWLQEAAYLDMRFDGALLDAFERGVSVELSTYHDRRVVGVVSTVGEDFVAVTPESGLTVFVNLNVIQALTINGAPKSIGPASERVIADDGPSLLDVLGELVVNRPRLRIIVRGSAQPLDGELHAIGVDVITLAADFPAARTMFVHAGQIAEVSILR